VPIARRLLEDHETVLLEAHPHWRRLVSPVVAAVAAVGMVLATLLLWGSAPVFFAWVLVAVVALAGEAAPVVEEHPSGDHRRSGVGPAWASPASG